MIAQEDSADILLAEGESGGDTVGYANVAVGLETQHKRTRPFYTEIIFNVSDNVAQQNTFPLPVAYWGNFITSFDGNILAGQRLDGLGTGFCPAFFNAYSSVYSNSATSGSNTNNVRIGNQPGVKISKCYPNTCFGASGFIGLDIFFRKSLTDFNAFVRFRKDTAPGFQEYKVVNNKIPQIINIAPFGGSGLAQSAVYTRRRPEGYGPGEDGIQVFYQPGWAATPSSSGGTPFFEELLFKDPATSSPVFPNVDVSQIRSYQHVVMNITP